MTKHVLSPLRGWLGGKYRIAKTITALIPRHICYVEPFAGAAWVLFHKTPSKVEVLNDINGEIINLYRCIRKHQQEVIRLLCEILPSRAEFERFKMIDPCTMTDIERAVRFLYLHRLAFGGKVVNQNLRVTACRSTRFLHEKITSELTSSHQRLQNVMLEQLNYHDVIRRYDKPSTFFYIDPPYWDCEDFYGKGIFGKDDFYQLSEQLSNISGKFILSLNDTPEVRDIFANFEMKEIQFRYSGLQEGKGKELLISNFVISID